jgi:hypothetical protein
MYSDIEKEYVSNKIMEVNAVVNRRNYQIKVWKSTIVWWINGSCLVVFTVLLVLLLLVTLPINKISPSSKSLIGINGTIGLSNFN